MNLIVRPMKKALPFIVATFLTAIAQSAEPVYTPEQVDVLIQAGCAKEHGAQFANQGLGCKTYLWKDSADHHVFFFRRDGVAYGEFRDEVLEDGRFLSIYEQYLVDDGRRPEVLAKATELRFVCKETLPVWRSNVVVESKVRWSFLTTDRNGKTLRRDETKVKRMIRGVVSVIVPDAVPPEGDEFSLNLKRSSLTPHEASFGREETGSEWFGPSKRRCSIWAQWPEDDPELILILSKHVPIPPDDSSLRFSPFRNEEIASMKIRMSPPSNIPIIFIPDER